MADVYAVFDGAGNIKTYLPDSLYDIPEGAIKLTDDLYMRMTQEKDGVWKLQNGEIIKTPIPSVGPSAESVRAERDRKLSGFYDPAMQILRRELEMSTDETYTAKLILKRTELHLYAKKLQQIPDQNGFPGNVVWPEQPSAELE